MSPRALTLLPLALLAACPAPEAPARFADATAAEREAAIHAAVGTGPALGFVALVALEQDAVTSVTEGGCLEAVLESQDPPSLRVSAESCQGESGAEWDGALVATNASLLGELLEVVDGDVQILEGPMAIEFHGFSMRSGGSSLVLDGTVEQTATEWGAPFRSIADLSTTLDGVALVTDLVHDCEYQGDAVWCDVEEGGRGSVPGLGGFAVEGGFSLGGAGAATRCAWTSARSTPTGVRR